MLLALFFSFALLNMAHAAQRCDTSSLERAKIMENTVASLRSDGWTVKQGEFKFLTNSTHFGANPGNPYGVYDFGLPSYDGWKLGPQDVILNVACTPPKSAYFSFRSYVFTQNGQLLFASLGDSLNHQTINTTASSGDGAFEKTTAVLTTADEDSLSSVQEALVRAGFPVGALNEDIIPSSLINLGRGLLNAYVVMLHRASVFQNSVDRDWYYQQTHNIYMLSPPRNTPSKPLPVRPLRQPGSGHSEMQIPGLVSAVGELQQSVVEAVQNHRATVVEVVGSSDVFEGLRGYDCINKNINCYGDNRDCQYLAPNGSSLVSRTRVSFSMEPGDLWVIFGSNHVETGKCAYFNIGLYYANQPGVAHDAGMPTSTPLTVSNADFVGSAASFAPSLNPNIESKLFAYAVSRDCSTVTKFGFSSDFCLEVSEKHIPKGKGVLFTLRMYLDPITSTRPALSEVILPSLIRIKE